MKRFNSRLAWITLALSASGAGCAGGSSTLSNVVEAIEGLKGSSSPVVEAYIQYPGTESRWAGPVLWTVHVSAHDSHSPVFEITPALPRPKAAGAPELVGRIPASSLGLTQGKSSSGQPAGTVSLTQQQVRERLQHLAEALASADEETASCLSSVKVRLTRADGTVLEKQACRGSQVWTQVASELAAEFMTMSRIAQSVTAGT